MQAAQGSSSESLEAKAMALQKHLEEMDLAKEAIRIVREFACDKYTPTPTARIIKEAVVVKLNNWYGSPTLWRACFPAQTLGCNNGFVKYLVINFDQSPGSVWTHQFTHRKLGHRLFCNIFHGSWSCCAGIDSDGSSIKYPGFTDTVQI